MHYSLTTATPARLLAAIMQRFLGDDSLISLEGALAGSRVARLEGCGTGETAELRRNTLAPPLDFLVAPLSGRNAALINRAVAEEDLVSETGGLIHVQIASGGELVFGAYDNFHPNCVFVEGISASELATMKDDNLLSAFNARDA